MWKTKLFKYFGDAQNWMIQHHGKYQMNLIYVRNVYAVEYKKLIKI
jgi:hypothetical protein